MKKISFEDKFSLTSAVINGTKTHDMRPLSVPSVKRARNYAKIYFESTLETISGVELYSQCAFVEGIIRVPYHAGDIVAVMQPYKDCWELIDNKPCTVEDLKIRDAWLRKSVANPELMPHRILITGVQICRMQDISDDEIMREGILYDDNNKYYYVLRDSRKKVILGNSLRKAYSTLLDRINKRVGMYDSNPYVFSYDFKLIK